MTNAVVAQSISNTIQSQVSNNNILPGGVLTVSWMARAGQNVSPWWSPARDKSLRNFWKRGDHLSGAVYTMTSKMTAIPFKVVPRDPSIKEDVIEAKRLTDILRGSAQFGDGWINFFSKFVEDLLTCDNGAFAEVIGPGRKDGPLTGMPYSVAHLDSFRCQRTGNAEYPVIYHDVDGRMYKLHYTRVIFTSQMSSPIAEMNGVGFCAVSRCINVSQTLMDILIYKQEKLGSRPHRVVLITQGGLDPSDVQSAFQLAESSMDSQGLSRYSKVVVAGNAAMPEAKLDKIELSELPDGFSEETSIVFGMAAVALAFGVDARELFPAMSAGATRADALLAHLKQRGKGPGQIIQTVEMAFDTKYLPPRLAFVFDFQDDAEDRQRAEIRQLRANRRTQDMNTGAVTTRVMREQMLEDGDITESQFVRMELEDGRLPDGSSVLTMFYTKNRALAKLLDLGVDDPLDKNANDQQAMLQSIQEKLAEAGMAMATAKNQDDRNNSYYAMIALAQLSKYWQDVMLGLDKFVFGEQDIIDAQAPRKPDERMRNVDLTQPNAEREQGTDEEDDLEESSDDQNVTPSPRGARVRR